MKVVVLPLVALLAACSKSEPENTAGSSKAAPGAARKTITVKITGFSKTESGAT